MESREAVDAARAVLFFASPLGAVAAMLLRRLVKTRLRHYMQMAPSMAADPETQPERDAPQLQLATSATRPAPNDAQAFALFARMRHTLRDATQVYAVTGVAVACVLAIGSAEVARRSLTPLQCMALVVCNLGPVIWIVATVSIPPLRLRGLLLTFVYVASTCATAFILDNVMIRFAVFALPAAAFYLIVGNRWLKTIAFIATILILIPLVAICLVALVIGERMGTLWLPALLFLIACGVLAVHLLVTAYEKKRLGDRSIEFTLLWIVFLISWVGVDAPARQLWWAVPALILAATLTHFALLPLRRQARAHAPAGLLVLRVFDARRRSEGFFEELGTLWRFIGPMHLIAGTDSAIANLDLSEAVRCLTFRMETLFVKDDSDLEWRLQTLDCEPDPDGRYRSNDFFCFDGIWRRTFIELLERSPAVLVDLSGYGTGNEGVTYELAQLLARRPLDSFVLMTDRTTDRALLDRTLNRLWRQVAATAPSAEHAQPIVRVLHEPKVRALVAALCDAAAAGGWRDEARGAALPQRDQPCA